MKTRVGGLQCSCISNGTFISPHRLLKVARLYLEENWRFTVDEPENLHPSSSADFFLHLSTRRGRMELLDLSVLCDFGWEDIIKCPFIPKRAPTTDHQVQLG